jgi:hypothetical protein
MSAEPSYNERNRRERERMRALVERLSDEDLRRPANEHWTFTPSDVEPHDVTWINDSTRPFLHAVPPRDAGRLALRLAEEADAGVASLPPERTWPTDPTSLVNPVRAEHRAEHLDQIDAALGRKG